MSTGSIGKTANGLRSLAGTLQDALAVSDPGRLRSVQALKTVLAVLFILALYHSAPVDSRLLPALAVAFLMQCGEGASRRERQLTMILTGLALAVLVGLAGGLPGGWPREVLLVATAFLAFFIRQFVPRRAGFPLFGFTLTLIATILPGDRSRAVEHALGLLVALVTAFLVYFYLLPPHRGKAALEAVRTFCTRTARALHSLAESLWPRHPADVSEADEAALQSLLAFTRGAADNLPSGQARDALQSLLLNLYEIHQSLALLRETLTRVATCEDAARDGLPGLREHLRHLSMDFEHLGRGKTDAEATGPPPPEGLPDPRQGHAQGLLALSAARLSLRRLGEIRDSARAHLDELAGRSSP